MGRSVYFFTGPHDEVSFFNEIQASGNKLCELYLNEEGRLVAFSSDSVHAVVASAASRVVRIGRSSRMVSLDDSDVLHLLRSRIIEATGDLVKRKPEIALGESLLVDGRLWLQTDYWDEQGVRRKKPHWLFESFERYKRWLSKEFRKSVV